MQSQIPIIHPVIDYDYVFDNPIFGGELGYRSNLTSLSRDTADLRSDLAGRGDQQSVRPDHRGPAGKNANNCLLRGVPGNYTRVSPRRDLEAHAHRSVRPGVHAVRLRCAATWRR